MSSIIKLGKEINKSLLILDFAGIIAHQNMNINETSGRTPAGEAKMRKLFEGTVSMPTARALGLLAQKANVNFSMTLQEKDKGVKVDIFRVSEEKVADFKRRMAKTSEELRAVVEIQTEDR